MERNTYNYSTSPRKLEPDVRVKKEQKKRDLKIVKEIPRQEIKLTKEERIKQVKMACIVIGIFIVLLAISYRNSLINEKFSEIQEIEGNIASIDKENQQLVVNIENSLNLNNIEKQAKEQLGMQKPTTNQTVYVTLPKKDYIEPAAEEVIIEEESWIDEILNLMFNI